MENVGAFAKFLLHFYQFFWAATSVDAVPGGFHYLGPTVAEADECRCSSVTYSLISACGGCQGRNFVNWTTWSTNCSQTYETTLACGSLICFTMV